MKVINITPPYIFNSIDRDLSCQKCKKILCYHKILANFQIKSAHYNYFHIYSKEKMLSMHLNKFRKPEKWKNKKLKFINENYLYCSKAIIFQSNWSVYCIPILWICRELKHHQLRIRSEIFVSLEIILNAFCVWQYYFPLKWLFWL